jgi:hypothetical protein
MGEGALQPQPLGPISTFANSFLLELGFFHEGGSPFLSDGFEFCVGYRKLHVNIRDPMPGPGPHSQHDY